MSNDTSTGALSTKNAATGLVGSGERQRWRPGPNSPPTTHDGHITTCSSSAHATSQSSGPIGNGQAYTRWSDATASRAMTGIREILQDLRGGRLRPRAP